MIGSSDESRDLKHLVNGIILNRIAMLVEV